MRKDIAEYLWAVGRHWVWLMTSSLPIAVLSGLALIGTWTAPPWLWVIAIAVFLLVAPFLAWRDERKRALEREGRLQQRIKELQERIEELESTLAAIEDRHSKTAVLSEVLRECVENWQARVDRVENDVAGEQWCQEYIPWFEAAKARVAVAITEPRGRALLTIGPTDKVLEKLLAEYGREVAIPLWRRHREFLGHHIEQLKSEIIVRSSAP